MNKSENIELTLQAKDDFFNSERRNDCSLRNQKWDSLEVLSNNNNSIGIIPTETKKKHLEIYQRIGDYITLASDKNWEHECCKSTADKNVEEKKSDSSGAVDEKKDQTASRPTVHVEEKRAPCSDQEEIKVNTTGAIPHRPTSPVNSGRTSVNNSEENLSYTSDNYYADELIVLQNTLSDDEEEEVSLNSDDCVYAYRGGGEFDISLEPAVRNNNTVEDETDFLEMDFDPDLSSEIDPIGGDTQPISYPGSMFLQGCNPLTNGERQLFSSPIDDMRGTLAAPQSIALSKDFARVSLHLNQIKADVVDNDLVDGSFVLENKTDTLAAQSLPSLSSPLHSCAVSPCDEKKSKITGAKPKRISDRHGSTSSFAATKNRIRVQESNQFRSIKSNGNATVPLCSSNSFDERSSSCSFFREAKLASEDTCLDCLEEEFLANTLGKVFDWTQCPRCKSNRSKLGFNARKHLIHNNSGKNGEATAGDCKTTIHLQQHIKPTSLSFDLKDLRKNSFSTKALLNDESFNYQNHKIIGQLRLQIETITEPSQKHQRNSQYGNGDQLLTDKTTSTFPITNVNEETIVQALEKLHISYNTELIQSHFKTAITYTVSSDENPKPHKNFKQFILHESKKNCNVNKLKRLIEMATKTAGGHVPIELKYHPDHRISCNMEMVPVQVTDILNLWTKTNNLEPLKQLDKRFIEANVLGKVAYVIRQFQQRCTTRRPMAEFILIPQYYQSGYITLIKK